MQAVEGEGEAGAAEAAQGAQRGTFLGAEDLLRWKALRLQRVQLSMHPAQALCMQVRSTDGFAGLLCTRRGAAARALEFTKSARE